MVILMDKCKLEPKVFELLICVFMINVHIGLGGLIWSLNWFRILLQRVFWWYLMSYMHWYWRQCNCTKS